MSIFIQEVLGLLHRNKKQTKADFKRDYIELGRVFQASVGNPGYQPKGEPFILKLGDLKCQILENVVLQNGTATVKTLPMYAPVSGTCVNQNTSIEDSIASQSTSSGLTKITIDGGLTVNKDTVLKTKIELGTSGDTTHGTSLFNRVLDSAGAEAGAANRVLRSLADGRVVWSDDDPVVALPQGNIWVGNAQGIQQPLPPGTAGQLIISDGTTVGYKSIVSSAVGNLLGSNVVSIGSNIEIGTTISTLNDLATNAVITDQLMILDESASENKRIKLGDLISSLDLVTGTGTALNVAMFTASGSVIGNGAPVPMVWSTAGNGRLTIGSADSEELTLEATTNIQGPIKDSASSLAGSAGRVLKSTASNTVIWADGVTGSGTANKIPLWTPDGSTLGDSIATQSTALITIAGAINVSGTNANQSVFENDGAASNNIISFKGSARFEDNTILRFGAGNGGPNASDLSIYHSATTGNSIIGDVGTGDLLIHGQNKIRLVKDAIASETYADFNVDAGVNLYHDNVVKFQTVTAGATVRNGGLTVEGPNGNDGFANLAGNGVVKGVTTLRLAVASTDVVNLTATDVTVNGGLTVTGAANMQGPLTTSGSGANGYLYVSGNTASANPTNVQGMAFAYNNSAGSRENELFFNPGTVTSAQNDATYFAIINEYLDSANGDARVTDTLFKLYGNGMLELTGPASTSTIANTYWRLPKVAAGNTGMAMLKSAGSIDLEWKDVNTFEGNVDSVPSSATAAGTAGQIKFDANHIYVCYADNNWRRAALSTF